MPGYLQVSREAAKHRATRRVSEPEFLRMSREPGTIVLDARSKERFDELHVSGALNLSFIALYNYGYRNVYELAPLIDVKASALDLVSSR